MVCVELWLSYAGRKELDDSQVSAPDLGFVSMREVVFPQGSGMRLSSRVPLTGGENSERSFASRPAEEAQAPHPAYTCTSKVWGVCSIAAGGKPIINFQQGPGQAALPSARQVQLAAESLIGKWL